MGALAIVEGLAAEQNGVATARQCRQAGMTEGEVRTLCRSRRWLRVNQGVYYVAVHNGDVPRVGQIQAGVLSAGPFAVAVLSTAAELHHIAGASSTDAIHVNHPGANAHARRSSDLSMVMHQLVLTPADITTVRGIPVTTPARTVADLVLRSDRLHAVAILDSALNRRILVPEDLDLVLAYMAGRPGVARARPWLGEVDARAESPLETRVRLRAVDGGLPPDELQFRVPAADGRIIAITDLAWLRAKVIGEADGVAVHDTPSAIFRDRKRQNDIVAAGYAPVRFTWADTLEPYYVPRAIHAATTR